MDRAADARRRALPLLAETLAETLAPLARERRTPPRAVRLSIIDRCDLACTYCRPHRGDGYLPSHRRLAAEGWASLVATLVRAGVERVRITGGEPLLHPEVVDIVARLAAVPGVRDLALTTNGTQLARLAKPLFAAGLQRLNVSVDSLVPERFWRITRGGRLDDVLAGVEAARAAGFRELKTNTVVMAAEPEAFGGLGNEGELVEIARWAWSMGATPRFLEMMSVGEGARGRDRFVPHAAMRARLAGLLAPGPAAPALDRGPARYVDASDGSGRSIGFITGSSDSFCDGCDRLRVTSDGELRACLATSDAVDVRAAIELGDERAVLAALEAAWARKPDGRTWAGCAEDSAAAVSMRATGG